MQLGFAPPMSGSWVTPEHCARIAIRAEELGYRSLWTFQRLLSPVDDEGHEVLEPQYRAVHDPLTMAAFLAGQTQSVRIGIGLVNAPYYSPALLAKALTTIDHLSSGRLDVGIGIGWLAQEFAAVGAPYERRGARTEDFLRCLESIWTEEVVDYDGEFYRVPRAKVEPKPVQRPYPPIVLGGAAEPALRRAGRLASGWISSSRADLAAIDRSIGVVRAAAVEAGRDPATLRMICRGVVKVRDGERAPLVGSLEEIRGDLDRLAAAGVTETFVDLNFDPLVGSPHADPEASMRHALRVLEGLAPED
ncbi:MAG: TIGR03619 family F420-dependent LLM class oxidoreductase [Acidimicrobiales bacterium]